MRCSNAFKTALFLVLPLLSNCQTPAGESPDAEPSALPQSGNSPTFNIGALRNSEVRDVVYQSLSQSLEKTESLGQGESTTLTLGELADFKYEVVKLIDGEIDVSGASNAQVDGLEIEVRGWLKRTTKYNDGRAEEEKCAEFESRVRLKYQKEDWVLSPGSSPSITREGPEDCYE